MKLSPRQELLRTEAFQLRERLAAARYECPETILKKSIIAIRAQARLYRRLTGECQRPESSRRQIARIMQNRGGA